METKDRAGNEPAITGNSKPSPSSTASLPRSRALSNRDEVVLSRASADGIERWAATALKCSGSTGCRLWGVVVGLGERFNDACRELVILLHDSLLFFGEPLRYQTPALSLPAKGGAE